MSFTAKRSLSLLFCVGSIPANFEYTLAVGNVLLPQQVNWLGVISAITTTVGAVIMRHSKNNYFATQCNKKNRLAKLRRKTRKTTHNYKLRV